VKPASFEYHAPSTAREAVELLAELGDSAKVIAGGQSLVPVLAMRLAIFDHLIDIRRIDGLRGIEDRGRDIWIGAGTTEAEIGQSGLISAKVPLLARATPLIGHFQIRNRGTIGGSLAHADASAEYPAVVLVMEGVIEALSPRGTRTIPAAEFFTGIWETALEPDELLTGVSFPAAGQRQGFAIEEFARRPGDFAVAGAAVAVELAADGAIARASIGLFGLGSTPLRAAAAEALAVGGAGPVPAASPTGSPAGSPPAVAAAVPATVPGAVPGAVPEAVPAAVLAAIPAAVPAAAIGQAAVAGLESVPSDLHGTADYRKKVGAAMVARAWDRAVKEAADG
jgi:carbon-monoxide dehydrogenase medium subunit